MTSNLAESIDAAAILASTPRRRALRICMVAYAFYESDTRILQYASALAKRGDQVDVIALNREGAKPEFEILEGVNVYRVQSRAVNEKGLFSYGIRILRFLVRSMLHLRARQKEQLYDLVHVHNVPDFLVFSAMFAKWKKIPVVLDIHDLLPEFYASKFKISHSSLLFKTLTIVERCSAAFATHVIVANHLWRDRLVARSVPGAKCTVIRNRPDLDIFTPAGTPDSKRNGRFVLIYPGSLNWHQGLDVAIRAFARVAAEIPNSEFHIYGEGPAKSGLIALATDLGMHGRVMFHEFLPSRQVAQVMAGADLAIEPKRAQSAFGNEALSTKILEFMALGVPIIASRTTIHAYYYSESVIQYYDNDDEAELGNQMLRLNNDPELRRRLVANARNYARENSWDARKGEYLELVDAVTIAARVTA